MSCNYEPAALPATAWVPTPRRTQHTGLAAAGLPSMGKIVQATAVARLASQGGWGKEPPPPTILGNPLCRSRPTPLAVITSPSSGTG